MSGSHPDLGPELRQLAQTLLDRLDPAVRLAAARAGQGDASKCEQVWCPVCALAALVTGEQHPLLTMISEHSVALLAVVRAMVENLPDSSGTGFPEPPTSPSGPPEPPPDVDPPPPGPGRYQHIPVDIDD
jgi:hypothetical protein